jgi:hypothetical protein
MEMEFPAAVYARRHDLVVCLMTLRATRKRIEGLHADHQWGTGGHVPARTTRHPGAGGSPACAWTGGSLEHPSGDQVCPQHHKRHGHAQAKRRVSAANRWPPTGRVTRCA